MLCCWTLCLGYVFLYKCCVLWQKHLTNVISCESASWHRCRQSFESTHVSRCLQEVNNLHCMATVLQRRQIQTTNLQQLHQHPGCYEQRTWTILYQNLLPITLHVSTCRWNVANDHATTKHKLVVQSNQALKESWWMCAQNPIARNIWIIQSLYIQRLWAGWYRLGTESQALQPNQIVQRSGVAMCRGQLQNLAAESMPTQARCYGVWKA